MDTQNSELTRSPEVLNPDTRQRLEMAALEVFSKNDFHRASIRDVAKKAGVSFSSIYDFYGNKEGLLFACIDSQIKELTERMIDHLGGIKDLKEKLRKAFWVQMDFYERKPDVGRILFLTTPFRKWMADYTYRQEKLINLFIEVLKQGQKDGVLNPDVRAGELLDFIYGLVQRRFTMWIYRGQNGSLSEDSDRIFEMIWRAISNPKE
jgi:AcrR family transcriptional regulator